MNRLSDKVAVITGAASGIGLATSLLYIEEGAKVVLVDRDEVALKAALKAINSPDAAIFAADVTDPAKAEAYVQFTLETYGRIDIAVFNAGIAGVNQPLEEYPLEVFDAVMAVNMKSAWLGMRAVVPSMKAQSSGSIIMTSSIQGLAALGGTTAYTTSKHALVGMMKGAALELAAHKVRVNTVHPGFVDTPMMDSIHEAVVPDAPDAFADAVSKTVPMGRYAQAKEIAQMMVFLGSDDSTYSTGSSFIADGGILASLPT